MGGWYDVSRSIWYSGGLSAIRTFLSSGFFTRPQMQGTIVNYDVTRALYRNDHQEYNLGAGFVRPIIDLAVEYVGLPYITSDDDNRDVFLNECIHDYWGHTLLQAWRDSMRDSKVVVRFRQPRLDNPLFNERDRLHGKLDIIPPEMVDIVFDPTDPDLIAKAVITHYIDVDERTDREVIEGDPPRIKEHEVLETITPDSYTFFDKTMDEDLTTWGMPNPAGFAPLWPLWNEYDAALGGGQSDIEPCLPFIQAFHEVMLQSLAAHKYHSTPKAFFKLKDVSTFLRNNYPDVVNTDGSLKAGAQINWEGREIFFFETEEEAGFIEAKSELGDSKTLLDFLIDCICIAAETPKWAILKDSGASDKDASVQPFEKKIARKRMMFEEIVVLLCKMVQVVNGQTPETVRVMWHQVRLADLAAKAQAMQQVVLSLDVATTHKWISDDTAIAILGTLWPEIDAPSVEKAEAQDNEIIDQAPPAPASDTQGGTNGTASKAAARTAVATAKASGN